MEDKNSKKKLVLMIAGIAMAVVLMLAIVSMIFLLLGKWEAGMDSSSHLAEQDIDADDVNVQNPAGADSDTENTNPVDSDAENTDAEDADPENSDTKEEDVPKTDAAKEDPQNCADEKEMGADVNISEVINQNENREMTVGIDVSKYQGTIDWSKAASSGIDFVMVRVGYRELSNGKIVADSNAKYNMQEAQKNGIAVGVYFFSTAISQEEAIEEANWVADYIAQYAITYPVAYDCEGYQQASGRQYSMTKSERTQAALAFLNRIKERGYTPMFYAAKSELEGNQQWETDKIAAEYKIWVAQYPSEAYPSTAKSSYTGVHAMWQYTNQGTITGISQPVDVNIAYFGYDKKNEAQNPEPTKEAAADPEALMQFTSVNETVTAKERTNLRDIPSQGDDSTICYTLTNGETATRTGVSSSGWSRVVFNGKTYYAVSSYLTTDLNYQAPTQEPDDGIQTEFKEVNHKVTAKEAVNLRTLPSVTNEASQVVVQLKNGEVAVRTGINTEVGWSRVEYNGQVLYCISSYLIRVEE